MRQIFAGIGILLLAYTPIHAEAPESQVKAAILANFALFVDWPPTAFSTPTSPFVACVLGKDPFGPLLKHEMGDSIGSHPVEIRHPGNAEAARECHIVYISPSEQPHLKQILSPLRNTSALIIGDSDDTSSFCREGGMIALAMQGNKVRFALNADAAAKAGLKIDSKLKRIASSTDCGE